MSKWNKISKKVLAGILITAMVVGYAPQARNAAWASETNVAFDEKNIVLKMGVMSDLHLSYGYHTVDNIKGNVVNYAKAVGTLNAMSGNDLDVLMLAGDYTSYGCYEQGKTFASASKAIMDAINKDKLEDNKTQFFFTYGNHDTEWNGQMSYAEWEDLLGTEYGLLTGLTKGPENSGCYKYTRNVDGKTYYFFSVETETYNNPSNTFRTDVLEWLDEELAATPKDAYVYVVSHGPIKESGVYGSDIEYDKNADWGTAEEGYTKTITRNNGTTKKDTSQWEVSSNIHSVLKKYPQVMYFSGHTHYTNTLESSIMSDMYTAISVSAYMDGVLYSPADSYLDGAGTGNTRPAYSLYIEVDANGNQRITRVNTSASTLVETAAVDGEAVTGITDPTDANATINAYYAKSVTITYSESGSTVTLTPWVMQTPTADGAHLKAYSAEGRRETPVFNEGNLELTEVTNIKSENLKVAFSFPTAKCENNYVIRYEFTLYDENGNAVDTQWILGNWTTNTDGVTENGKTHKDATTLSYEKTYTREQLAGVTGIYATLTAVDEFGGRATLTSGDKDHPQSVGIMKPSASGTNKNMFDGVDSDRIFVASMQDVVTNSVDEKGVVTITSKLSNKESETSNLWTSIRFALSKYKYEKAVANGNMGVYSMWAAPGIYPEWYTDLEASDTYVYEADFTSEKCTGFINFQIRTADVVDSAKNWETDYNGVRVSPAGVALWTDNKQVSETSTAFRLTNDNVKHHITIVSAPETISVWIDDILVLDGVSYVPENPERLNSRSMLPTMAIYVHSFDGTITNQSMYLYDQKEQIEDEYHATDVNLFDESKVTYEGSISNTTDATYPTPAIGGNSLGAYAAYDAENIYQMGRFYINLDSTKLTKDDTVITEFDFTPSGLDCGSDNKNVLHDIVVLFRKNASGNTANYLMRTIGNWIDVGSGYGNQLTGTEQVLKEGKTLHCKIISEPTSVSVYVGGMLVVTKEYTLNDMIPYMEIRIRNGRYEFKNISIRKVGNSMEGMTAASDENNLLNGTYGEITSSHKGDMNWEGKSDFAVNGNNFCTDLTWMNLKNHGATSYYMGEDFYPFGKFNSKINFKGNESFVMSALVRVANQKLAHPDTGKELNHRVGMEVASYNGKTLWYFIDTSTLYVYYSVTGRDVKIAEVDLGALIGYNVGDYLRLTTVITPFGFDIYTDGTKAYGYSNGAGTNVSYSSTGWIANGVAACFLDASVHYNYDNTELYKEKLLNDVSFLESLRGVYMEKEDALKAKAEEIKAACEKATSSEELWQYVGAVRNGIVSSGKIVNNMILDGTTSIDTQEVVDTPQSSTKPWHHTNKYVYDDAGKAPDLKNGDVWVFEADLNATDKCARIGFSLSSSEGHVIVQGSTMYYNGITNATGTKKNGWEAGKLGEASCAFGSGKWHIKYTVVWGSKIVTELTNENGGMITFDAPWDNIYNLPEATAFNPSIYFVNTVAKLSNIYVGYDLAADVNAVELAVETAAQEDLSTYTWKSVESYKETLANAEQMNTAIADYVDGAADEIYTTPYSREEMRNAVEQLAQAKENLVKSTATVMIGQADVGSGTVMVNVANGTALPIHYLDDKYYIIGWTLDGAAVTTVEDATEADKYVAEYIDLDMLNVKYQEKTNAEDSSKQDIRFIASVNSLDYKEAGLVFSVTNTNPAIGGERCITKNVTTVYGSLYADGVPKTAQDIYGNSYSKYLYAWEYTGIPTGATIYARAFVKLSDGTVVYGVARAATASITQ